MKATSSRAVTSSTTPLSSCEKRGATFYTFWHGGGLIKNHESCALWQDGDFIKYDDADCAFWQDGAFSRSDEAKPYAAFKREGC